MTITRVYLKNHSHIRVTCIPIDEFDSISSECSNSDLESDDSKSSMQTNLSDHRNRNQNNGMQKNIYPLCMLEPTLLGKEKLPSEQNANENKTREEKKKDPTNVQTPTNAHETQTARAKLPPLQFFCEECGREHFSRICPNPKAGIVSQIKPKT